MTSPMKTTEQIVREFQRGQDRVANFELLYKRYYVRVLRFVLSLSYGGFSREDAEDLTNDVFLAVWQGLSRLQDGAKFEAYLLRMAKNMCINEINRRRTDRWGPDYDHDLLESVAPTRTSRQTSPEEMLRRKELVNKVWVALREMPPRRRRVMLLYLQELPIREIAEFLDITSGTVKASLYQARKYLQERLGGDFADCLRDLSNSHG